MFETVEAVRRQFDALAAKVDPLSAGMLEDSDYVTQLGDCIARTYVMLNNGMCEELTMCRTCAEQRDYLRDVMVFFDEVGRTGQVTPDVERRYFRFIEQLSVIRRNIRKVLVELRPPDS